MHDSISDDGDGSFSRTWWRRLDSSGVVRDTSPLTSSLSPGLTATEQNPSRTDGTGFMITITQATAHSNGTTMSSSPSLLHNLVLIT